MNKILITLLFMVAFSTSVYPQSIVDEVLLEIEKNNTTLAALRSHIEAEKIGNKTGLFLDNPELGFNYLWGNPSGMGNRTDLSITQSFDFPTVYKYQNQISDIRNEQADLEYEKNRIDLLFEARFLLYDLISLNAFKVELVKRVHNAEKIASSYGSKLEAGETNILEFNKAQLNLLNAKQGLVQMEIERSFMLSELKGLNGGKPVIFDEALYESPDLPSDFEQWYLKAEQNSIVLNQMNHEVRLSQKHQQLSKAESFPKLQAGYMSEKVTDEQFGGLTLGMSIPLWEYNNTVKLAKAELATKEAIVDDYKLQYNNRLKSLHTKAMELNKTVEDYRSDLSRYNNSSLLQKALDQGEITLIDYLMELSYYNDSVDKLLKMEKELNRSIAELYRYM